MRYHYEMQDGIAHLVRSSDGQEIGRALTEADACKLLTEFNANEALRDRLLDVVTDAIEEVFE